MDTVEQASAVEAGCEGLVTTERVGVIVVHGIGEQQKGDHLEEVVRPLVKGLGDDDKQRVGRRVVVHAPPVGDGPARATLEVGWRDSDDVERLTEVTVHEVHWADINEPNSLGKGLRFWLWGLSAWLTPGKYDIGKGNVFDRTMATPVFPNRDPTRQLMLWDRVILFVVGWLFLLAAPLIIAADFIAKKMFNTKLPASLQTIVAYVSAVKLYTQERRSGRGLLESCNELPRMAIRRRMAAVIADVATLSYDRWYVLAHSQGTVVAFNGLMAPAAAWPNYLGDAAVAELVSAGMAGPRRDGGDGPPLAEVVADFGFRPAIPPRRTSADLVVYRDRLFARFRGLLTYGSPLDKFAAIWPPTVAINRQSCAFAGEAVWVNVWDPNDPVGGALDAFDPDIVLGDAALPGAPDCGTLAAINIPCRASPVFLVSHVAYLTRLFGKTHVLARWIGDWILGFAGPGDLVCELRTAGRLVGEPAHQPEGQGLTSAAAVRRRTRISVTLWLVPAVLLLLYGWVEIFGWLGRNMPSLLPGWLMTIIAVLIWPFVLLHDSVAGSLPTVLHINELAGALAVSLALVVVAGPFGRWLTPLDPRDSRSVDGRRESVLINDWRRLKHAVTGESEPSS